MEAHEHHERCPTCGTLVPQSVFHEHEAKHGRPTGIVPAGIIFVKPKRVLGLSVKDVYPRFSGFASAITDWFDLSMKLEKAGLRVAAPGYAAVVATYTFASLVPALVGFVLAVVYWSWIPLLLLLAPPVTFFGTLMYLSLKAVNRRDCVENELPILATYMAMKVTAGDTEYKALQEFITNPLLPAMREESNIVVYNVELLKKDPVTALEGLARTHPSERFSRWIHGLTYTATVGGNVSRYLENSSERTLADLSAAWRRFSNFSMMMADAVVAIFALLPLCLFVMVSGFVAAASPDLLVAYTFIIAPLIAFIMAVIVDKQSPRTPESYDHYYKIAAATFAIGAVASLASLYGLKTSLQLALAVGAVIAFLPPALKFEIDSRRESALEKDLPEFLADVTESHRIGQPLESTIVNLDRQKRYGAKLNAALGILAWNITIGTPMDTAVENAMKGVESWYSRIMFFLFKVAATTGGATVPIFERLARFTRSYTDIRKGIRTQLRTHIGIFYATSLIVVYTVTQVIRSTLIPQVELAQQLGGITLPGVSPPTATAVNILTSIIMTATVVNSALLGLLAGKISGGCLAGGFKHVVLMVIATAAALVVAGVM